MGERNTVTVRIYGQEYSICADTAAEYITKVADYVDGKMNELGFGSATPMASIAVLAAVNICDELLHSKADNICLADEKTELEKELSKCNQSLLEAQKSIEKHKEEMNAALEYKMQVQKQFSDKEQQIAGLMNQITRLSQQNEALKQQNVQLNEKLAKSQSVPEEASDMIKKLELSNRDLANSFYDIQLQNIQLKNELEALKKQNQNG